MQMPSELNGQTALNNKNKIQNQVFYKSHLPILPQLFLCISLFPTSHLPVTRLIIIKTTLHV